MKVAGRDAAGSVARSVGEAIRLPVLPVGLASLAKKRTRKARRLGTERAGLAAGANFIDHRENMANDCRLNRGIEANQAWESTCA